VGGLPELPETAEEPALPAGGLGPRAFRNPVVGDIPQGSLILEPRPDLLAELGQATRGGPTVHALTGMPGVGKTQLAAGYARARLAEGWRLVAWVNAESTRTLLAGLAAIADTAGLSEGGTGRDSRDLGRAVRRRLEADGDRCLVVFDNASDLDALRPFVPAGTAQVLITSDRQQVASLGTSVPVDGFTADEALAFLARRTGLTDGAGAAALAIEVAHLPLALAQAAAVIAGQCLTYDTYVERLRALPVEEYLPAEKAYPHGTARAVLLSLDAVRAEDKAGACTGVMEIMAVLSAAGVRRGLLHSAGRLGMLAGDGHRVEADLVDRALEQLTHHSLLTSSLDGQTIMAHALVMQVVRDGLARRKRTATVCRAAAVALEARARAVAGSKDRQAIRDIPEQVATLLRNVTTLLDNTAVPAGEAEVLTKALQRLRLLALCYLIELGDSAPEAVTAGESLTADLERELGADHPDMLTSRDNLATAYQDAGRVAEAIPLFEQTLAAREQALGADHPDTLTSRNNLATAHWAAGRVAEAVPVFGQVLAVRERLLGYYHPITLTTRNNLATAYWAAGRVMDAIPLHEEVLAARERALGPDHPDTLISLNNLAAAYRDAGRVAEAIRLFEEVLVARERVLGPDHPGTVTTRNNLAFARSKRARRSR
jgi:tetratricopeptide (TPR) repeat protein